MHELPIILFFQVMGSVLVWDTCLVILEKNIRWACRYCEPTKRRKCELMLFMRRCDCCSHYSERIQACIPAASAMAFSLSDNEPSATVIFMCNANLLEKKQLWPSLGSFPCLFIIYLSIFYHLSYMMKSALLKKCFEWITEGVGGCELIADRM